MGSVRKAAVTAGLGAAIVTGAAAPALAADQTVAPQAPTAPKIAEENAGTVGPFNVGHVTDTLGTGQVTGTVGDTAARTLPAPLPSVSEAQAVTGLPTPPPAPTPAEVAQTAASTLPAVPDLGVPGVPGVSRAADAVTANLPAAPALPGVPGVTV